MSTSVPPAALTPSHAVPTVRERDWLGAILVTIPLLAAAEMILAPWYEWATIVTVSAIGATVFLIGIDARRHRRPIAFHIVTALLAWVVFFPYYVHQRAGWGTRGRLLPAVLGAIALFVAPFVAAAPWGGATVRTEVHCAPAGDRLAAGIRCGITSTYGRQPAEVCWDVAVHCANNTTGHALSACGEVAPSSITPVFIPFDRLTGVATCDRVTALQIERLEVSTSGALKQFRTAGRRKLPQPGRVWGSTGAP